MINWQQFFDKNEIVFSASVSACVKVLTWFIRSTCILHTGSRRRPIETECCNVNVKLPFRQGNGAALCCERASVERDSAGLRSPRYQWLCLRKKKKKKTPSVFLPDCGSGPASPGYLWRRCPRAKSISGQQFQEYSNTAGSETDDVTNHAWKQKIYMFAGHRCERKTDIF